ncbi:MAG TPA: FkbM family methyltransferase [Chlamydiales bacterium]|nr:FkbM family methyltransferase [Chlamydiales bacterium]
MNQLTKLKQQIKKYVRYSPILGPLLTRYLQYKTIYQTLPEMISESLRLYKILARTNINVILDVGANNGITGIRLRNRGYKGKIISFEPIPEIYAELEEWAKLDSSWECHRFALGNENGVRKFNILGNKPASSFLEGNELLFKELANCGGAHKEREEIVEIKKLDDIYSSLCKPEDLVLLKIDTQGFEKHVLDGAEKSLKHIRLVKMEAGIVQAYKSETSMTEMIQYMKSKGFIPILIETGHVSEETHYQIQADIVFTNLAYENS